MKKDKKELSPVVKNLLVGLGVLFIIGAVFNVIDSATQPELTQTAKDNTFKNAFVVGCEEEAAKYPSGAIDCTCGYDALAELYPDFSTNEGRLNRIIETGYNKAEIRATLHCYPQ